jgi:hypothetical protein
MRLQNITIASIVWPSRACQPALIRARQRSPRLIGERAVVDRRKEHCPGLNAARVSLLPEFFPQLVFSAVSAFFQRPLKVEFDHCEAILFNDFLKAKIQSLWPSPKNGKPDFVVPKL